MKQCISCKENKKLELFPKNKRSKDGIHYYCKECQKQKVYSNKNFKHNSWKGNLKRYYGITPEQYEQKLSEQDSKCKICDKPEQNRRLSIDHDHETGKVRDLLCQACNVGLGGFKDDIQLLERAIEYLKFHA